MYAMDYIIMTISLIYIPLTRLEYEADKDGRDPPIMLTVEKQSSKRTCESSWKGKTTEV